MDIITRIKQVVSANIDALIEKAEDPETTIEQIIRDMDKAISDLKMEVARTIATEKRLARRIQESEGKIQSWQEESENAVMEGDDGLARKAIAKRLEEEKVLAELKDQHQRAADVSQTMKDHLRHLEDKTEHAKRQKEILIARKRMADAQKSVMNNSSRLQAVSRKKESQIL
jgi:phage shock protein A